MNHGGKYKASVLEEKYLRASWAEGEDLRTLYRGKLLTMSERVELEILCPFFATG